LGIFFLRLGDGEEVAQTMYTHVSKCKNYKIKGEKKRRRSGLTWHQFLVLSGL
jgi:hypothetical protein